MADKVKLAVAILLVVAGLAAFYYFGESLLIVRVLGVIAGLVLAALVASTSAQGRAFYAFARESVAETKKVVWPTRKETVQTTGVVAAFVITMAVFLWIVDASLMWLLGLMMGRVD
jgi:preprotein translocase subunit SecE